MTQLCHLVDEHGGWEESVALEALLPRIPAARWTQAAGIMSEVLHRRLAGVVSCPVDRLTAAPGGALLSAPRISRWLGAHRPSLIHAWGPAALKLAGICRSAGTATVFSCSDPALDTRTIRALRLFAARGPVAVACAAQRVRRRLVEQGVPPDVCGVIRPAVDFGRIRTLRQSDWRPRLGLAREDRVVLVPVERPGDETVDAVWALMVQGLLDDRLRVLVAGRGREHRRIRSLARASYRPQTVVFAPAHALLHELICAADALLIPQDADAPMTSVAWAMAAGTLVVAAAGYAVAEIIAHRQNGLLYKRAAECGLVVSIARCFAETQVHAALREAARGQAYEVFSQKRYVDQHLRLYDNLLSGRPAWDGITDSAAVA